MCSWGASATGYGVHVGEDANNLSCSLHVNLPCERLLHRMGCPQLVRWCDTRVGDVLPSITSAREKHIDRLQLRRKLQLVAHILPFTLRLRFLLTPLKLRHMSRGFNVPDEGDPTFQRVRDDFQKAFTLTAFDLPDFPIPAFDEDEEHEFRNAAKNTSSPQSEGGENHGYMPEAPRYQTAGGADATQRHLGPQFGGASYQPNGGKADMVPRQPPNTSWNSLAPQPQPNQRPVSSDVTFQPNHAPYQVTSQRPSNGPTFANGSPHLTPLNQVYSPSDSTQQRLGMGGPTFAPTHPEEASGSNRAYSPSQATPYSPGQATPYSPSQGTPYSPSQATDYSPHQPTTRPAVAYSPNPATTQRVGAGGPTFAHSSPHVEAEKRMPSDPTLNAEPRHVPANKFNGPTFAPPTSTPQTSKPKPRAADNVLRFFPGMGGSDASASSQSVLHPQSTTTPSRGREEESSWVVPLDVPPKVKEGFSGDRNRDLAALTAIINKGKKDEKNHTEEGRYA